MFTAAALIECLEARYRRRFPLHAERPFGEFPPTWRQWFLSMDQRAGAVTGAPANDFIAIFANQALRKPPRAQAEIGRMPAMLRMLRQQWDPPIPEERGLRRFAALLSGLVHIVFGILLVWLAIIAIEHPPKRDETADAVQVEFIGEGTLEETGGGPVQGADEAQPPASAAPSSSTASSQAEPSPTSPPLAKATPSPPSDPEPTLEPPEPSPPAAAQPLVVTEPRTPPIEEPVFALPSTQLRAPQTTARTLAEPTLNTPTTEVEMLEPRPPVRALQRRETTRTPTEPELRQRVSEIEMLEPLPAIQAQTPVPRAPTPQLRAPNLRSEPGEIAVREPATQAKPAPDGGPPSTRPAPIGQARPATASPTASGAAPQPSATSGGRPSAPPGARPATAGTGVGPAATPRPGGLPSPRRNDDWGDSTQNRPGNATAGRNSGPGLFNSDGSIRIPSGNGQSGGGLPPGMIIEDFEKIDRMGTWLKRPTVDYTPGRLERLFVPHGTLLEEWVRRNIREVFVPIPGTRKRLVCKVSLLQAGGGCTIDDPNLRDQEAEARKPPDIPFKPDLQESPSGLTKP